jgi:hypothetical protein
MFVFSFLLYLLTYMASYSHQNNRIGGVMVGVLTSSAVDRGFEPQSCRTKDLVFVASPLSTGFEAKEIF